MPQDDLIAFNLTNGKTLAPRVFKADDYASRSKGLLGRESLNVSEGLWIVPCPMIHTFFMKFSIDAVFLSKNLEVVKILENLKPWRLSPWVWGAYSVLELAAGVAKNTVSTGDVLEMRSCC